MVTIRIPAPPRGLFSNLLGVAGLAGVIAAIGALTDWRWALLASGLAALALSYVAQLNAAAEATRGEVPTQEIPRLPGAAPRSA